MTKIIVGLAGLNLILAGYLAVALTHRTASNPVAVSAASAAGTDAKLQEPNGMATKAPGPAAPAASAEKLTWASIVSGDLRRYAANLREAGCPEQTIKDIMLAEANRVYGLQERAFKVRPDDVAPWEKAALYDRRNNESKLRQLLEEKRALLKELTGIDVGIDMPSRLAGRDVEKFEGAFGAIPDTKRDQVRAIQENYWSQSDAIKQRTMGYLEPEDRAEFERIKAERRTALAAVLTPAELQDFEIKTSDTAPALRSRFDGFAVTDDEFKKVFEFMQPLDEKFSLSRRNPDPVDPEFTAARSQAEKELEQQIQSVLGDERFAEYQRTRDPAYRTLRQAALEAGVPQESILQAYEAQRQMQDEAKRIMQDTTLTQEQRMQGLQQMRGQAEQTMQQFFGDKTAQVLDKIPGARMTERYALPATPIRINPTPGASPPPANSP